MLKVEFRGLKLPLRCWADEVIKELTSLYQDNNHVVIGAGTVLDATTARIVILAEGEQFFVSPLFNEEAAKLCNQYPICRVTGPLPKPRGH